MGMQSLRFQAPEAYDRGRRERPSAMLVGIFLLAASSVVAIILGALKYGLFESLAR